MDLGFFAWSPLGRGVLTGKYRNGVPSDSRGASPHFANFVDPVFSLIMRRQL
jgi:aryl-alcohol dehydrogenase-like predicted oxidoreductase